MRKEFPNSSEVPCHSCPGIEGQSNHDSRGNTGYEIRVRDHLDQHWYAWFEGWTINNQEDGEVLLSNPGADQSALHGALNKVRDLNLTLLSVAQMRRLLT